MVFERRHWVGLVLAGFYLLSAGATAGLCHLRPAARALAGAALAADDASGLHLPQSRRVSFSYYLTDGAGFRWDVQVYGTIGSGTNSAFSGAMYCQLNGTNVRSPGYGWVSKAGDEVEIGPYNYSNLRCYRRIRVYRNMGLARWLDVLENPTNASVTVQVAIHTNRNYTIRSSTTSSGKGAFGARDWALITTSSGPNSPAVLHVMCDKRAKVRPAVEVAGNTIFARYNLTIPAGKTVVLCHFLSQAHGTGPLEKMLKTFRAYEALKDLSPGVRKLIVNFAGDGGIEGVELDRSEATDTVILKSGDPIYGKITNESFAVAAFFGRLDLPAAQVVGMAAAEDPVAQTRFVLVNGQVISGTAPGAKLNVALSAGGVLNIPLEDIGQWSYRISPERPSRQDPAACGPFILLRTGDKLTFDPQGLALSFRTRQGVLPLDPEAVLEVSLDNRGNAVHRAVFLNGSRLAGFLEPARVTFRLKLGRDLEVDRSKIARIRWAPEVKPDPTLTEVILSNEDQLRGRILADKIHLVTRYNPIDLTPRNIRSIRRDGQSVVEMWNGTVHKGRIAQAEIDFQIVPGPKLSLHVGQLVAVLRPQPLPPEATCKLVEELVARLGAESYRDRQEATEQLMQIKGIASLLQKHLTHGDPEVRQRIEEILQKTSSGGKPAATAGPGAVNRGGVFLGPRR